MTWKRCLLPLLLVGALAVGCDDDSDTTGPDIGDLAGDWNMTGGTLVPDADPNNPIPLNAVSTIELDVDADGSFELTVTVFGAPAPTIITGTFDITGENTATITNDDDPNDPIDATFSLTNSNNTLTVAFDDAVLIDVTQDGQLTDADAGSFNITFARETS